MLFDFATIGVFLVLSFLFVFAALIASRIVQPFNPYPEKETTYECGESPVGGSWIRFNNRFYIIALIFIIFDVEVVFIFPCAVVFRELLSMGLGVWALVEIIVFVGILLAGLAYVWAKGDLQWIKTTRPVFGEKGTEVQIRGN